MKTKIISQQTSLGFRPKGVQLIDAYELSPTQAGMVFHGLSQPNSGIDVQQVITLGKALDPDAVATVWRKMIERHAVMRSSFRWEGTPQPVQNVWDDAELSVELLDWRDLAPRDHKTRLSTFLAADRKRGFDLSVAPVMRLTLIRSADELLIIVWTFHHSLLDGRSIAIVLREAFTLYQAWVRRDTISLALPKASYREHIEWLRNLDLVRAESYWRNTLKGFQAPIKLWVERPHGSEQPEDPFGAYEIEIEPQTTKALNIAASAVGVTVNTILQGAWAILLSRLSGARDVVFGATRACRRSGGADADEIVGLFINTLPVRVDVDLEAELGTWLRSIREQSLAVREFEHTPLVKVQSWSEVTRTSPLFESILVYEHLTLDARLRSLGAEWQHLHFQYIGQTNYPLALIAYGGTRLQLRLEYSRCRFEDDVARRLMGYVKTLLEQIATSGASRRLASLSFLPFEERQELITPGRPVAVWSASVPLHGRFEEQAGRFGDRIAVMCEGQALTYAELNARANRLAHRLRELGAQPDDLVGLCTERGLDMIVGMLGILKSGAAYLPLEPAYPDDRIAFMLKDAQARIVVTEQSLAGRLSGVGVTCLMIDLPIEAPDHNSEPAAGPDNLAYAIYTSGSTGKPKGALITHANVGRLFESTNAWFGFGPEDVWTLFHSFAFDFSVWEVWGALLYGGRLVIVPYWVSRDPSALRKLLLEQRVSVLNQTPSAFRQLLQADLAENPGDYALRYIIFGGEALELHSLRPWFERYGDQRPRLINMYGITETTVHVTYCPISLADVENRQGSVIGVPIPGYYIRLLDAQGQLVPVGVPGEVYVGGAGVARGYLNRPELTAQRFIADPLDPSGKARLYRSGDLARRLANGNLEFLGRIDQQVKIRGFRIELGEIEAAIARSARVADVAVIVREDIPAEKCLVAYVVASGSSVGIIEELRKALNSQLPDHMVPANFILLDTLPLNANGKLDRNALPAPRTDSEPQSTTQRPFVAPRTEIEQTIAEIWMEVLRLKRVGVADHFFEVGGDSILMIQVVSRCRRAGLHVTAKDFFEHPTIAELAKVVSATASAQGETKPIASSGQLTPIQQWFFEQNFEHPEHWNQAFLFCVPPDLDLICLEQSIGIVATHHDALRLRFRKTEAGWTQVLAAVVAPIAIARYDLSQEPFNRRTALLERYASSHQASLNFVTGPLISAAHFTLGAGEQGRLLLVVHHLVIDAVSWKILLEDIEAAYTKLIARQIPTLPSKTTSYKVWADRLADYARTPGVRSSFGAWGALTASPFASLPGEHPGSPNLERHAGMLTNHLAPTETEALLRHVHSAYRTQINDVLLTALARTLQQSTDGDTFLIDVEGHGREHIGADVDVSRTIGWFTAVFPVLLQLHKALDAASALKAIKEQLRGIPDRGLSYGLMRYLSDDLAERKALSSTPQRQVLFNYLGQFDQVVSNSKFFRFADEPTGPWHYPGARRTHKLEIICLIRNGKLEAKWTWNAEELSRANIEQLADGFLESLRWIIAHCLSPSVGGRTPSDFPLARLDQRALDRLWDQYPGYEEVYRLTSMQRLFFFAEASHSGVGFQQWQFRVEGRIVPARLRRAFEEVIARHTILRTAFSALVTDEPVQVVVPSLSLPWTDEDLRDLSQSEQERTLSNLVSADASIGFDVSRPPLMRVTCVQLRDNLFHLVWSTHHLCIDGWSWPILFQEVSTIYDAFHAGVPSELRPPLRYSQYVAWLHDSGRAHSDDFWRNALSSLSAPTAVGLTTEPRDRSGRNGAAFELAMCLGTEDTSNLQAIARANQVTLSTLVQGAWALLLAHYNSSDDVVFGAAFSGRPAELQGIETMIGPCVTNVPVRVRIERSDTLSTWLRRLQQQQFDMAEHQYTTPETIRSFARLPLRYRLFDTLVVFQNYQKDLSALRIGQNARLIPVSCPENTNYAVTLAVSPASELRVRLIYNPAILSHGSAQTYAADLRIALKVIGRHQVVNVADVLEQLPAVTRGKAAAFTIRAASPSRSDSAFAVSDSERSIAAIWRELLGLEDISFDANFFDIGGHSLLLVHVQEHIQRRLRINLPIISLLEYPTIRTLARHIDGDAIVTLGASSAVERAKKQREALRHQRNLARSG